MWSYRRSRRAEAELESRLRAARRTPPDGLVEDLSRRMEASRPIVRRAWSRVAYAGAVSTLVLGTFASFGGLSYAAAGATSTFDAAKKIVVQHRLAVTVHRSSASDQYKKTPRAPKAPKAPSSGVAGNANANGSGVAPATAAAGRGGTLPFTGFSLLGTVILGLVLMTTGIFLRRRERRDT